jgi:hypothetical protein
VPWLIKSRYPGMAEQIQIPARRMVQWALHAMYGGIDMTEATKKLNFNTPRDEAPCYLPDADTVADYDFIIAHELDRLMETTLINDEPALEWDTMPCDTLYYGKTRWENDDA